MLKPDIYLDALEFIQTLDPKRAAQIWKKIQQLCEDPTSGNNRKLEGSSFSRMRAGDYRIIFEVEGEKLNVILVGPKQNDEVYKTLKRLYG